MNPTCVVCVIRGYRPIGASISSSPAPHDPRLLDLPPPVDTLIALRET